MIQHNLGEVSIALGQKNSGKSVLLEYLATKMDRYLIIDPYNDHNPPNSVTVRSGREILLAWAKGHTELVLRGNPIIEEEQFIEAIKAFGQLKNVHLIIDEVDTWTNANYCPEELKYWAQFQVSHKNSSLFVASRQATPIPSDIWTQVDNYFIYFYGAYEDAKIKQLPLSDEYKQQIRQLEGHQFVYWRDIMGSKPQIADPIPLPKHMK